LAKSRRRSVERLSAAEARRVALAAQGFSGQRSVGDGWHRPIGEVGPRQVRRLAQRLGLLQIDSVSVLVRAHYMPTFSRLGPYPREVLDALAYSRQRRRLFEYWAHEASLLPVETQPLLRWRMARAERGEGIYGGLAAFGRDHRALIDRTLAQIRAEGALRASEIDGAGRGSGSWWGWSETKRALEWLFWAGLVTTRSRRGFERVYDLPERVLPRAVQEAPTPPEDEAQRTLLTIAARALGVATETDLRDYFRMPVADTKARLTELVEAGALVPIAVEGWRQPAYLHADARVPRRIEARALLSPFDSLIFERGRTERLFGFRYRIEIYTPEAKRLHGYYVLPFLFGERLVARVDLKADRPSRCLRVPAIHGEPGVRRDEIVGPLMSELRLMADWLGLERIEAGPGGDLSGACQAHLAGL
jgi:uncharacterized protein YcaQ